MSKNFKNLLTEISYEEATQREVPEEVHDDQNPIKVDIFRIKASKSYRLLKRKTQVFLTSDRFNGDNFWVARSRDNHSDEAAETAARIARKLGCNEDLATAIGLAHDLGHAPGGHAGEKSLIELLINVNEYYTHEVQTVRNITLLEKLKPTYIGLNLTHQLLSDLAARAGREKVSICKPEKYPHDIMSLPGQILEWAEKLTYIIHDLEDGLRYKTLTLELLREYPFLSGILWQVKQELSDEDFQDEDYMIFSLKSKVYNYFLKALYDNLQELILYITARRQQVRDVIFLANTRVIKCSDQVQQEFESLLKWMYDNFYSKMKRRDERAFYTIETLFNMLLKHEHLRKLFNKFNIKHNPNEPIEVFIKDLIVMSDESFIKAFMNKYCLI